MIQVRLEWYEVAMAAEVGLRRKVLSLRDGRKDGAFGPSTWSIDIMGAIGELAWAKYRGEYWSGGCDTFKAGDVGEVQVRWVAKDDHHLIVRPADADDDWFVLTKGEDPTCLHIVGYIQGQDAKHDDYQAAPNGKPAAWFVPQARLVPLTA